jgi:hypothetical protein
MSPLSPAAVLNHLRAELKPWAESAGVRAQLSIARDPFEVIEVLGANPPGLQIVLIWEGDEDFLNIPEAGIIRHRLAVVVSMNRGLRLWRGENLATAYGNQPALLERVDEVRQRCRLLRFPPEVTDQILLYKGADPEVTPDGLPLDAYRLRFHLTAALPHLQQV